MSKSLLFVFLLMTPLVSNSKLGIYKCVGEGGVVNYQEQPCQADEMTMLEKRGISDEQSFEDALVLADVNLKHYSVSMIGFDWWQSSFKEHDDNFAFLKWMDDKGDTSFSLLIDIIKPKEGLDINQSKLRELTAKTLEHALQVSLEKKLNMKPLIGDGVMGFYQQFTDSNLLGKESYPPGEYLYTTKGLFTKSGLLFRFTLLSNDYSAQNHQFAFSFLTQGIRVEAVDIGEDKIIDKNLTAYEQGMALVEAGKLSDSLNYFAEATKEEPNNPEAWVAYCLGLREFNRLQSAFIACDRAAKLEPKNFDTQYRILNLLIKSRLFNQALHLSTQLIKQDQSSAIINAINNLGYFALMDNHLEISQQAFDLISEIEQSKSLEFKLKADLALLAAVKGDVIRAEEILDTAEITSDIARKHINIIRARVNNGPPFLTPHEDEESYVIIPKELYALGSGQLNTNDVEDWVTQVHPLKGVAEVKFTLPESWEIKINRTIKDDEHHNLSVKSVHKNDVTSLFSLDVGKVANDWTLADLKNDLMDMQKLFMSEPLDALKPLSDNRKGFEYEGVLKKEDTVVRLTILGEMYGSIIIMAHGLEVNPDMKKSPPMQKIINSISLQDSLPNPIDDSSDNIKVASNPTKKDLKQSRKKTNDTPLPEPENGFIWHRMPEAQAAFLKPDGWYTIEKHEPTHHVYSIMKEDINPDEKFDTGLTLMAFPQISAWANVSPYTFSLDQIRSIEKDIDNTIIKQQDKSQGPFLGHLIIYENDPDELPAIIVHKVFVANEKTGSLYIISFEAPKTSWDEAWKIGEKILENYLLDDEF